MNKLGRILPWLLLGVAAMDLAALRGGLWAHSPSLLAVLVGLALLALFVRSISIFRRATRPGPFRGIAAGELLLLVGLLVSLGFGLGNWLLGLQGFVVLLEGDVVTVLGGSHLQQFDEGPLARVAEMDLVLALSELELLPAGEQFYYPESRLVVEHAGPPVELTINSRTSATSGSLRFYQGAFGFAPRVVITTEDETLFDRVVPLITQKQGPTGPSFEGSFDVEDHGLSVQARVDLSSLDEAMRGHASLDVAVWRGEALLGGGQLRPGHFAEVAGGYSVGFVGLEKWSEIDISRRNYRSAVFAGGALALAGMFVWPVAAWRTR